MPIEIARTQVRRGRSHALIGVVAGALLAAFAPANAAEDCLSFNTANVSVQLINGTYKVVDGGHWMMDFGTNQANAIRSRDMIQSYGMNKICFVGRGTAPKPFMYFRIGAGFPSGSRAGQVATSYNPYNTKAVSVSGTWRVRDCSREVWNFGSSSADASTLASLVRTNNLRTLVTIGSAADPDMSYFLQDLAYRPSMSLGVALAGQEMSNWCWAATGRMIMRWHGVTVAQCDLANERLGRNTCCNVTRCPTPDNGNACNSTGWPDVAFNNRGFLYSRTSSSAISWQTLWDNISCDTRPVGVTWAWAGGGGHIMVASGVRLEADGTRMVRIHDPLAVCAGSTRWVTYAAYVSVAGQYTHWDDFYNIRRN